MKASFLIVFVAAVVIGTSAEIYPGYEYPPGGFNRLSDCCGAYARRARDNCIQIVIRPQRPGMMAMGRRVPSSSFMSDCGFGNGGLDHSSFSLGVGEDIFRDPAVEGVCRTPFPSGKGVYSTASAYPEPERIFQGASTHAGSEGLFSSPTGLSGKSLFPSDVPVFPSSSPLRRKRIYSGMNGIFDRGIGDYRGNAFV